MRSFVGIVAITLLLSAPADARSPRTITLEQLGWPASTRSAIAREVVRVHDEPGDGGHAGKLAPRTRIAWTQMIAARGKCKAWLAIEPRGWVCAAELKPSDLPPAPGLDPSSVLADLAAKQFLHIAPGGARAYATQADLARQRVTQRLPGFLFLQESFGTLAVGDRTYQRTSRGYVDAAEIELRKASDFVGVEIANGMPGWPLAWAWPTTRGATVPVRGGTRTLGFRELVVVHELKDGWARIGVDEWVPRSRLRVAGTVPRPQGVGARDRWIDVDLDEQVLVMYAGDTPIYATLISTGRNRNTDVGRYRIEKKFATTRLIADPGSGGYWNLPYVPFTMKYRLGFALHGAYWHDSFGTPRSHGCVNLSPRDARAVFERTSPVLPEGWTFIRARGKEGTVVQIRDAKHPSPPWIDFNAPRKKRRP